LSNESEWDTLEVLQSSECGEALLASLKKPLCGELQLAGSGRLVLNSER